MAQSKDPSPAPILTSYARQLFLCAAGNCAPRSQAQHLQLAFNRLARRFGIERLSNPHRVRCMLSGCLGVCSSGPILVVYPEGIWYHRLDEAALERIVREHLLDGRPVEEYIFHRLYPPGQEPAYAPALRGDGAYWPSELEVMAEAAAREAADTPSVRAARSRRREGQLLAYHGEAGRDSAALGVLMRSWARQMKAAVVDFGDEDRMARSLANVTQHMGMVHLLVGTDWSMAERFIGENELHLVCLNNLDQALDHGAQGDFLAWLQDTRPPALHVLITGHQLPDAILQVADVVQHFPAAHGAPQRPVPGIDF